MRKAIHIMDKETKQTVGYLSEDGGITMDPNLIIWFPTKENAEWMIGMMKEQDNGMLIEAGSEYTAMDEDLVRWEGANW